MSDDAAKVVIRKGIPEDKDFILDSWCKGQYYGSPYWVQIPKHIFHNQFATRIVRLLSKSNTSIDVAVLSEDPNTIIGFIVYSGSALHWAYTKNDYRGYGILNLLLKDKDIQIVTSTTLPGAAITKKKKFIFNPFSGEHND